MLILPRSLGLMRISSKELIMLPSILRSLKQSLVAHGPGHQMEGLLQSIKVPVFSFFGEQIFPEFFCIEI